MSAQTLRRRLDRLTDFASGPPRLPILAIERVLIERRADGSLWRRPYSRQTIGGLREMLDGEWEPADGQEYVPSDNGE